MDLLEYQGKAILKEHGIAIPQGRLARNPREAEAIAAELGGQCMVKAQVRQGRRGKAGLVKPADSPAAVARIAADMFGIRTAPPVNEILVERHLPRARELYLAIRVDDARGLPVLMASLNGGIDIESTHQGVVETPVDVLQGLARHEAVGLWKRAGLRGDELQAATELTVKAWQAFWSSDAALLEINPLVVDDKGRFWAADAKVSIDDNALYRHLEFDAFDKMAEDNALELRAKRLGVNTFIDLGGNISVMSSGASFGMMLLDRIVSHGGKPANFMDMGGRATGIAREKLCELTVFRAEHTNIPHVILIAFVLTSQSLKMITEAVLGALGGKTSPCPTFAWVCATHVATQDLSREQAYTKLAALGVRTFDDLDAAVSAAVEAAAR